MSVASSPSCCTPPWALAQVLDFVGLGGVVLPVGLCLLVIHLEEVSGRPLLLLGVLLIVLGVQILGFGLVGEIIIFSQARNLKEYRIARVYETRRDDSEDEATGESEGALG